MAYELGGVKKRPWWDLLLESFGAGGVGFGGGPAPGASLLDESPVAAPVEAAETGGAALPEETEEERVARLKRKYLGRITPRSKYAAKRRETLLGELGAEGYGRTILGAPAKMDVSWRQR